MTVTVHLLASDPVFTPSGGSAKTITDSQQVQINQNSTKQVYKSAGTSAVQKIAVDAREDVVSVTTLNFPTGANVLNVGEYGSLTAVMQGRADGIGLTGSTLTKTWPYAVIESISAGPTIDGSPTFNINFACKPLDNV